jgi:glyoxylase-like metal-dependent hydrolase (beta-lactamase superfamily II)
VTGALTAELAPGVHRIPVPTPFAVGPINCYLLMGEPLTLVDTGPNSGTSLDYLERGLAEVGVRVEDLELIVLTHQHMDHEGLLEILERRAQAEVAAFAPLVPWIAEYRANAKADDEYAQEMMRRHGLPDDINMVLGLLTAGMHSLGSKGTVTRPLLDGDVLALGGREYSVHHRPGHSPSDLVFFNAETGLLIGGDHLLARISSNALVTRPLEGSTDGPRPTPLIDYSHSLRATREMDASMVLTGHGEEITDHATLIDTRLADQNRRARKILAMITDQPLTAHQIAQQMWGEIAIKQAYLTLSEVLGHLDLLLAAGTASEGEADGVSVFAATAAAAATEAAT